MESQISIYLDTNILYNDIYWKSPRMDFLLKNSLLANYVIYIPEIVIEELKQKIRERINDYNRSIQEIKKRITPIIKSEINQALISAEDEIKSFDLFYEGLLSSGKISIVNTPDDIFKEIIERSIKKVKPFEKGRQEFRDAVIWLTCADHANKKYIERGVLLTNNTKDFAQNMKSNRNGIIQIHSDLAQDSLRIKGIYASAKSLVEKEEINVAKLDIDKPGWLDDKFLSRSYLRDMMRDRFDKLVLNSIESYLARYKKLFVEDPSLDDILNTKVIITSVDSIHFLASNVSTVLSFSLHGKIVFDIVRSTASDYDYEGMTAFEHDWIKDIGKNYSCEVSMSLSKPNRVLNAEVMTISVD